eukprot:TRINITY_DN12509_c0_g1_i1.p1 TRINITY_DN12509_c0_g1~~TRINITY_DN12509_c0_g1_i1.p1  ORF type:complete len:193 (-),score=31.31 TRINITY_DN12509_c0_g1_i1:104-682(-)
MATFWAVIVATFCCQATLASANYVPSGALAYAAKWWNTANHQCSSEYDACTPWSYWGEESCGYQSHGGDCANFVSQSLIAGGHPYLNQGFPCRGYPCGKEEVGAKNLGDCLSQVHHWNRTCGYMAPPPSFITEGDVLILHAASCEDEEAHATIITDVQPGWVGITCHSNDRQNASYAVFKSEFNYFEWLHFE